MQDENEVDTNKFNLKSWLTAKTAHFLERLARWADRKSYAIYGYDEHSIDSAVHYRYRQLSMVKLDLEERDSDGR